jgi:hypothetical protein
VSTGISGTKDAITGLIMFTVIAGILYYLAAVGHEVYLGLADMRAAQKKGGGVKLIATSSPGAGGAGGDLDSVVNPMFLRAEGDANLGANVDSLVASIMAQKEPPPPALWLAFREEFAATVSKLKDAKSENLEIKTELSILQALTPAEDRGAKKGGARRVEFSALDTATSPLATERRDGAARAHAGSFFAPGAASGARRGIFSTQKSPLSSNAPPVKDAVDGDAATDGGGGGGGAISIGATNPLRLRAPPVAQDAAAAPPAEAASPPAEAAPPAPSETSETEPAPAGEGGEEDGLPSGWRQRISSKGKVFYYNPKTKETAWSKEKIPKE